jgi:hypothetical protein
MNQGAARRAILERRDDVSVGRTRKLMALLWEVLYVISEGLAYLLSATLHDPGVARVHVRPLEIAGKDLSEVILTINDVS